MKLKLNNDIHTQHLYIHIPPPTPPQLWFNEADKSSSKTFICNEHKDYSTHSQDAYSGDIKYVGNTVDTYPGGLLLGINLKYHDVSIIGHLPLKYIVKGKRRTCRKHKVTEKIENEYRP